jgi:hypothetical protein
MGRSSIAAAAVVALGLVTARSAAQDNPPSPQAAKPGVSRVEEDAQKTERRTSQDARCTPSAALRVQLVITRLQDGKKAASLPYTFVVSARPSQVCSTDRVRMRMGVDTPIPTAVVDDSGKPAGRTVQYKTVGTNIDCWADDLGDGRFKLFLGVENSSALAGDKTGEALLSDYPLFRKFEISLVPILREGQKAETVTSTDPVTGEVVKIDVSLAVVK